MQMQYFLPKLIFYIIIQSKVNWLLKEQIAEMLSEQKQQWIVDNKSRTFVSVSVLVNFPSHDM